jgi:hypothetical protein
MSLLKSIMGIRTSMPFGRKSGPIGQLPAPTGLFFGPNPPFADALQWEFDDSELKLRPGSTIGFDIYRVGISSSVGHTPQKYYNPNFFGSLNGQTHSFYVKAAVMTNSQRDERKYLISEASETVEVTFPE